MPKIKIQKNKNVPQLLDSKYNCKSTIIHITCIAGSGEKLLAYKISQKFRNRLIIKELDELKSEFLEENKVIPYKYEDFQNYIDNFIHEQKCKPIIFIGLNDENNIYYNLHTDYKYFIDVDCKCIVEKKYNKFVKDISNETSFPNLLQNNKTVIKDLQKKISEFDTDNIRKYTEIYKKKYELQGYILFKSENMLNELVKVYKKSIQNKKKDTMDEE